MHKFFKNIFLLVACCGVVGCNNVEKDDDKEPSIDMSKYPNFVEDLDNFKYSFGDKEIQDPFWRGNIIYNESVLMLQENDDGEVSGNLMYVPKKIISVKDFSLKKEYKLDVDYKVEGRKIILLNTKEIDYRTHAEITGEVVPEGYVKKTGIENQLTDIVDMGGAVYTESPFYYGSQLAVTYAYDINDIDKEFDTFPKYRLDEMPKLKAKLENKEAIKIVGLGDSVLQGCSSSKMFNHEPFMENFLEYTRQGLGRLYDNTVTLDNLSVGGMKASWGVQDTQLTGVINAKPDLFFLHFGINDLGDHRSSMSFFEDIESICIKVKTSLPDCSIVVMSPFDPNPGLYDYLKMADYFDLVKGLETEVEDLVFLDIFDLSKKLGTNKRYLDMSANGINHPNDFAGRIYLGSILNTLFDYKKGE